MVRRASDHDKLLSRRANAQRRHAQGKKVADLTELFRYTTAPSEEETKPVRRGIPIGQRWD